MCQSFSENIQEFILLVFVVEFGREFEISFKFSTRLYLYAAAQHFTRNK